MKRLAILCVVALMVSSLLGTMCFAGCDEGFPAGVSPRRGMPDGMPKPDDIKNVQSTRTGWEIRKPAGTGGCNYAKNFLVPKGRVLIKMELENTSCIRAQGGIVVDILMKEHKNFLSVPVGVRIGNRLEPGSNTNLQDLTNRGDARCNGDYTFWHVPIADYVAWRLKQ